MIRKKELRPFFMGQIRGRVVVVPTTWFPPAGKSERRFISLGLLLAESGHWPLGIHMKCRRAPHSLLR